MTDKNQLARYTYEVDGYEVILTPKLVQESIANGNPYITSGEITLFIELCKAMKYNPFTKDAYLIKYDDSKPANIVVSKDLQMKRAFDNPSFEGFQAGIIIQRGKDVMEIEGTFKLSTDILLGGWAKVYIKGSKIPVTMKVSLTEYNQGKALWNSKPATMIRKVALAQALREAFPKELAGTFTEEEIQHQEAPQQIEAKTYEPLPFEPTDEADFEVVDDAEMLDEDMEKAFDEVAEKADEEMKSFLHADEAEEIVW